MALQVLTNAAGDNCTAIAFSGVACATGYEEENAISGPRSRMVRSATDAGPVDLEYDFSADVDADYMVIARADKLLTAGTTDISIRQRDSGDSWSAVSSSGEQPLTSSHLIGPTSQDYVEAFTPSNKRGYALRAETQSGSTEAVMLSKLFFCEAFTFGVEPDKSYAAKSLNEQSYTTPPDCYELYDTERYISLLFRGVTRTKVDAFLALPQIMRWPFFLYDDDSSDKALWDWQLEHVVLESFSESYQLRSDSNLWDINLVVRRLRHYD